MSIQLSFAFVSVYILVFARLAGMILLNPLFARVNVPSVARMGLVLFLMLLIAPLQPVESAQLVSGFGAVEFIFAIIRELCIGAVYGYIFQIFYYLLFFVGDMMDTDFGIAMAKTFDPATNIQASFSGKLLTVLFSMYIFASGSHLALIKIFADSFTLIPLGKLSLSVDLLTFILTLFSSVFMLAMRLIAPFMVAEFILQASMGILMRFVPQVTVFVINFQLRILLGLIMLFLLAPFVGQFIDRYITILFDSLSEATRLIMGTG